MRVGLDCVHELPATYADMVDKDYLCPVVIFGSIKEEAGWGTRGDEHRLADNIYLRVSKITDLDIKERYWESKYYKRYGMVDYFIIIDKPEITNEMLPTAFDMLNDALSRVTVSLIEYVQDITFYYEDFLELARTPVV